MSALDRSERRLQLGAVIAGLLAAAIAFITISAGYARILFLIAAGLLVAVSVAYILWRSNPAYCFAIGFVLSCFSGHWADLGSPAGGLVAPDRILIAGALGVVLLRGPWMRYRPPMRVQTVHYLLLFAWLYAFSSALITGSFFNQSSFFQLFEAFGAGPFLVFLLAPYAFVQPKQRDVLLAAFVSLGAYLGIVSVLEVAGAGGLVLPSYINNPKVGIHFGRARGPFAEAVTNGTGLYCCAVGSAVAAYVWRERKNPRLIAMTVAAGCFACTFITFQRSVWLATIAATLVTGLAVAPLRRFVAPVTLIAALFVSSLMIVSPTVRRKATERTNDIGTVHDRDNLNRAAVRMIRARPLFGFGWEKFTANSAEYFQQNFNYQLTATKSDVHDLYLAYSSQLGLIGALIWVSAVLAGVGGALATRGPPEMQPWRAGLLAIAIFFLVVSGFVPAQVFPNLMVWLWAGVVWSSRVAAPAWRRPRVAAAAAAAVAAPPEEPATVEIPAVAESLVAEEPEIELEPWPDQAPVLAEPREPYGEAARAASLAAELIEHGRAASWRGPDPYDGLWNARWPGLVTSRRRGRQAVIQLGARSPVNLRGLSRAGDPLIPKAPALFGTAATRLWAVTRHAELEELARHALGTVNELHGSEPAAWGYPFPVQTRWSFYDENVPNVVVTTFCALALHEGAAVWEEPAWEERARAAAEWVLSALWVPDGGYFAYHPESDELVHNANLLGAKLVWRVLGDEPRTRPVLERAVETTIRAQRQDGSFPYGQTASMGWADSFHTGYVLDCLAALRGLDPSIEPAIESGAAFWTSRFFGEQGEARLWPDEPFPIDGHSAGTALTTLAALGEAGIDYSALAEKVAADVGEHGLREGHGVHRRWRAGRSRVVYPRWVDGHLALGLANFTASQT